MILLIQGRSHTPAINVIRNSQRQPIKNATNAYTRVRNSCAPSAREHSHRRGTSRSICLNNIQRPTTSVRTAPSISPLESTLEAHLQKDHSKDLTANKHRICVRKKARKVMLEKDRAESRKIATDQSDGTMKYDPALQYGCIVCRKRFHDYANMCRHRRLAHDREPASQNMPWLKFDEGLFNDGDDLSDTDSQLNGENRMPYRHTLQRY